MASENEPPVKRRRLSGGAEELSATDHPPIGNKVITDDQHQKEQRAGITAYVHPNTPGFTGILKTRYTDFLVNEILPNGQVLHLKNLNPPAKSKIAGVATDSKNEENGNEGLNAKVIEEGQSTKDTAKEESSSSKISEGNGDPNHESSTSEISQESQQLLFNLFGDQVTDNIVGLYKAVLKYPSRKAKEFRSVRSDPISDKQQRTEAHQTIRRIFKSKIETKTSDDDTILITATPGAPSARGGAVTNHGPRATNRQGWEDLGGLYVHFTLYKENRDTMEAISYLAGQLKVAPKHFQFGGTKDRRAVTVQRCSVYRVHAEQLAAIGKRLRGSKVGDFEYLQTGLELGVLGGNEFVITLRDCHLENADANMNIDDRVAHAQENISEIVDAFKNGGFINYYGLQRFGSFTTSTDEVGVKLLQSNFEAAVQAILAFNPSTLEEDSLNLISSDDRARAQAINIWNTTHNSSKALEILPRKFSAESNIIRHLGLYHKKNGTLANLRDFQGALKTIPRNLRLMYPHAYQSLVWNTIAGIRWNRYGSTVIEGDLVLISEHVSKTQSSANEEPTVDEQGEPIILPSASDGTDGALPAESPYEQARPLTAEEVASGAYTIFDIVLPLPGFDVVYPKNNIEEEYRSFMASEAGGGLDPYNMRRTWKDLSLSGSYRKLLGRPGDGMRFEIKTYVRDEEQLVDTDLDRLNDTGRGVAVQANSNDEDEKQEEKKMAVILWMKLAPSQYATMALRELMKAGGVQTFKPEYSTSK